jgi:hypothetical protein
VAVDRMKDAITKRNADNLANLMPYPIFSWCNYSHQPPVERVERLYFLIV